MRHSEHKLGKQFVLKQRIAVHPGTERARRGDHYGEVVEVGRKYVYVVFDHTRERVKLIPSNLAR